MGIVFRSQSEMASALRIIFCLLHGTQHHCANYGLFFSPLDLLQQILQGTRMNRIATALHVISEISRKSHKILQLLWIWIFVNPVKERNLQPVKMLSDCFIRRKHEFLDNLLGYRTLTLYNIYSLAVLIYDDFALFKIKVNRAPPHPCITQLHRQFFHKTKIIN